ncbi:MAG: ABC transporter ATP-binding protein [Acidimicrobiales bacterium]|nr:ABC transporter ATP-binding protein [Acidimicrobiales bacterium]
MSTHPAPAALRLDGASKRFGATIAVDRTTIAVSLGERLALVGPSGCGKSTLLRLVAGLHTVDAGTIEIGGRVVDDGHRIRLAPEHRHVGLVFQEHALFPHLSVADNVAFGLRRRPDRTRRAAEMLELVGLERYGERFPHELSGGERQRVALARALAPEPSLLLLDEPFASLDPNLRTRLRRDVLEILRTANTAAVLVTHDQSEALATGERVAVMHDGAIVQCDDPTTVFNAPVTRFVAAFMGEADFLTIDELALIAPGEARGGDAAATMMVRPDDLALVPDPASAAVIIDAEFRGSTWCYTVELPTGTHVRSIRSHIAPLCVGDPVAVQLVPGHHPVRIGDAAQSVARA